MARSADSFDEGRHAASRWRELQRREAKPTTGTGPLWHRGERLLVVFPSAGHIH